MPRPPLACSVRGCGSPLERRDRTFACQAGHSHDIARHGYVNLLQPQDRRSRAAGDSQAAVQARAALLAAGVGRTLLDALLGRVGALGLGPDAVVADLGSGSGDALGALSGQQPITGIGIDLSAEAAEHAARRFPSVTWLVANADRRLPLVDRSVDLLLSLHGRRNPAECARVLASDGFLLVALPAPDDLVELRALVHGHAVERERGDAMLAAHRGLFTLVERSAVRETLDLDRDVLLNLLRGTYRGARLQAVARVESLGRMAVTLSSEVFVLARRETPLVGGSC